MKRVAIVGSGGAGKSWLARELGRRLELEPIHLDALYYDADWRPPPADEWARTQHDLVAADTWIVDGKYRATMHIRLAAADTIVFLDTPTPWRLVRVLRRRLARRGAARPDAAGAERLDWRFLRYIATYNRLQRPRLLHELACRREVHVLRSAADVRAFLRRAAAEVAVSRASSRRGHSPSSS